MAFSEQQLDLWAKPGAEQAAVKTYDAIKAALQSRTSQILDGTVDIYLQGSYRNSTNVLGDSDVDIVIELQSTFWHNTSSLTAAQMQVFNRRFSEGAYTFERFRDAVERSLVSYFGAQLVERRNKCIAVKKTLGRLDADIVPCLSYRVYKSQPLKDLPDYYEGIRFYTRRENRAVTNYPKLHYANGAAKNQAANQNYKPTVRIFKNLRNHLQNNELLADGIAPSYFVECMLYNVPNSTFKSSYFYSVLGVLQWMYALTQNGGFERLICANGVIPLFGETPEQWRIDSARTFIAACITAWNNG